MNVLIENRASRTGFSAKAGLCAAFLFNGTTQAEEYSRFQFPLGFELEVATLTDVQEAFGSAAEFEIPDSHHQFGVCYFTSDSEEIIVFATGREFGGPTKLLLGVTLHARNTSSFPCANSTLESSDLSIDALNLSVSPGKFESLNSGQPERLDGGYVDFDLEYVRELTEKEAERFKEMSIEPSAIEGAYVGLGIWARFVGDSPTEVGVWQITTF